MDKKNYSEEELIAKIQAIHTRTKKVPTQGEFSFETKIDPRHIRGQFRSWTEFIKKAGFERTKHPAWIDPENLWRDWATMVRKLQKIPSQSEYERGGEYSGATFKTRFGAWSELPIRFREFAATRLEYIDVIHLLPPSIAKTYHRIPQSTETSKNPLSVAFSAGGGKSDHIKLPDRPVLGMPIDFRGLRHAPTNEQGVVFLFGMVARELGYIVESIQIGFPDCEGKRRIGSENWQRVRIEFEFVSSNYESHGHPPDGCDVIVCWRDNWGRRPENIEVVELFSVIGELNQNR